MAWSLHRVGAARVIFSDRHGGVSEPPYQWANLGSGTGDDWEAVIENRRLVGRVLGGPASGPDRWAKVKAEHGATVVSVDADHKGPAAGDGVITNDPSIALSFRVGDCGPLVLAAGSSLALAHVGWRGLAAGVVHNTATALLERAPGQAVHALLGPTIGPCCYTLPGPDAATLAAAVPAAVPRPHSRAALPVDVPGGISAVLAEVGIRLKPLGVCTSCSPDHFSNRRDGRRTGRQAVVAILDPEPPDW